MKTKDLIAALQEEDPSGEVECCIGNADIHFVSTAPAYWDGRLQILERDHSKDPYFNIVGAKITAKGSKIVIHAYSIEDYISDFPEKAVIDYSELGSESSAKEYREADERVRQACLAIEIEVNQRYFYLWASGKLSSMWPDAKPEDYKLRCGEFFLENREALEVLADIEPVIDEKGYKWHASTYQRLTANWENIVEFFYDWRPNMKIKKGDL
jgi:hypothetical protein